MAYQTKSYETHYHSTAVEKHTLIRRLCFSTTDNSILIQENKTWEESLTFCREHHSDLVSITSSKDQKMMEMKLKNATSAYVWLGLRYTCTLEFWFWVSNEVVHYSNWDRGGRKDDCHMSGAIERGGQQKWRSSVDTEKFNFMCSKTEKPLSLP